MNKKPCWIHSLKNISIPTQKLCQLKNCKILASYLMCFIVLFAGLSLTSRLQFGQDIGLFRHNRQCYWRFTKFGNNCNIGSMLQQQSDYGFTSLFNCPVQRGHTQLRDIEQTLNTNTFKLFCHKITISLVLTAHFLANSIWTIFSFP